MAGRGGRRSTSGQGRPKGIPNKVTGELKTMILNALEKAHPDGAEAYLADQAVKTPAAFLALVGKVLPLQVTGEGGGPVTVELLTTYKLPENGR
jgi:hypothetical protein